MRTRAVAAGIAAVAALIAAAAIAGRDSAGPAAADLPLVGVDAASRLMRLEPRSLRPIGDRLALGSPPAAWAYSPDRRGLLAAADGRLTIVDLERMRAVGEIPMRERGTVAAIAWPHRDRATIVLAASGCCAAGMTTILTVDPLRRRIVVRRRLAAGLTRVAEMGAELVLLLAPPEMVGPVSVATVDAAGRIDMVRLNGPSAGVITAQEADVPAIVHIRRPGLAVDPRRRRAYVLPATSEVVEVDLASRATRYHRLTPRRSLLDRLRDLVEPATQARPVVGPTRSSERPGDAAAGPAAESEARPVVGSMRTARWLGNGRIAVAGHDADIDLRASGALHAVNRPAGLRVIDTRRWRVHTIHDEATGFRVAGDVLIPVVPGAAGLAAYHPNGRPAFRVLGELAATAGPLAYVRAASELHVVDLTERRIVSTTRARPPRLLPAAAPHPWS